MEELPGRVALYAAADFGVGLLPGPPAGQVALGFGVVGQGLTRVIYRRYADGLAG